MPFPYPHDVRQPLRIRSGWHAHCGVRIGCLGFGTCPPSSSPSNEWHSEPHAHNVPAGNAKRVGDLAHRLKSSVDSLGITKLHGVVRELEALGKAGKPSARMEQLLAELEHVIVAAVDELRAVSG